jgi:hypothetical protein
VNPAPVNAERAWNRADWRDSPVATSNTVATRVTTSEMVTTKSNDAIAITL